MWNIFSKRYVYVDGFSIAIMSHCSMAISIANVLEILQSCTKPSIWWMKVNLRPSITVAASHMNQGAKLLRFIYIWHYDIYVCQKSLALCQQSCIFSPAWTIISVYLYIFMMATVNKTSQHAISLDTLHNFLWKCNYSSLTSMLV